MMEIQLNGQVYALPQASNLKDLVDRLELDLDQIAIEVNRAIVPRSQLDQRALAAGDQVEIVTFIGGG